MSTNPILVSSLNLATALLCGALGVWLLAGLLPVLADPDLLQANLVTLPSLHQGLPAAAKKTIFGLSLALGLASVIWAGVALLRLRAAGLARLHGLILIQLAAGLVLAELLLHGAGLLGLWPRNMLTYLVNPVCGETYHRLVAERRGARGDARFDPLLGWKPLAEPGHPGRHTWPRAIDTRPKAWFFGDSFMQGVLGGDKAPPAFYEVFRPDRQALNYAVGGYGVGQIGLRYRQVSERIPQGEPVFIGILTTDLDRTVLRFFGAYKPSFEPSGESYRLVPPPSPAEQERLLAEHPVRIGSYVFALATAYAELIETGFDRSEAGCARGEKRAVNAHALSQIIETAEARGHSLNWIVFVPWPEFYKQRSWRHRFLVESLQQRKQRFLDTREVLIRQAKERGVRPESFYIAEDGHLNAAGNRVMGEAMAEMAR